MVLLGKFPELSLLELLLWMDLSFIMPSFNSMNQARTLCEVFSFACQAEKQKAFAQKKAEEAPKEEAKKEMDEKEKKEEKSQQKGKCQDKVCSTCAHAIGIGFKSVYVKNLQT